jgi:hypothetical protein
MNGSPKRKLAPETFYQEFAKRKLKFLAKKHLTKLPKLLLQKFMSPTVPLTLKELLQVMILFLATMLNVKLQPTSNPGSFFLFPGFPFAPPAKNAPHPPPRGGGVLRFPAGQSNVFKRKLFQSSALDFVTYVQSTSEQFNLVLPMHNDIDLILSSKLNFKTKN